MAAQLGHVIQGVLSYSFMSVVTPCNTGYRVVFEEWGIGVTVTYRGMIVTKGNKWSKTGLDQFQPTSLFYEQNWIKCYRHWYKPTGKWTYLFWASRQQHCVGGVSSCCWQDAHSGNRDDLPTWSHLAELDRVVLIFPKHLHLPEPEPNVYQHAASTTMVWVGGWR